MRNQSSLAVCCAVGLWSSVQNLAAANRKIFPIDHWVVEKLVWWCYCDLPGRGRSFPRLHLLFQCTQVKHRFPSIFPRKEGWYQHEYVRSLYRTQLTKFGLQPVCSTHSSVRHACKLHPTTNVWYPNDLKLWIQWKMRSFHHISFEL